jgi:hypothetical protein
MSKMKGKEEETREDFREENSEEEELKYQEHILESNWCGR